MNRYTHLRRLFIWIFLITILALLASLSGCFTGHSYHRTYAKPETSRQKAARKPATYKQCDAKSCKVYDTKGNRRYDLEHPQ